jgi:hypothetical protein
MLIGESTSLTGTLIAIDKEAIILEVVHDPVIKVDENTHIINPDPIVRQYWIPKSSILLIEYDKTE